MFEFPGLAVIGAHVVVVVVVVGVDSGAVVDDGFVDLTASAAFDNARLAEFASNP